MHTRSGSRYIEVLITPKPKSPEIRSPKHPKTQEEERILSLFWEHRRSSFSAGSRLHPGFGVRACGFGLLGFKVKAVGFWDIVTVWCLSLGVTL